MSTINKPTKGVQVNPPVASVEQTRYIPPTKNNVQDKKTSMNVSMTDNAVLLICITVGIVAALIFTYCMCKLRIARRPDPNPEYEGYEESANWCFSFLRTSSRSENEVDLVQFQLASRRLPLDHIEEDEFDELQDSSKDRSSRFNERLHFDVNYKRRKKKFGLFR